MPAFKPIPTLRYAVSSDDSTSTADLTTKIAPPYDVLDEGPKQTLLQRDPHNIVAVDLPVTPPKTVGPDEAYAAAAQQLAQWIGTGVLVRDDTPSVIAYEQVYEVNGQTMKRRGLFCGLGLEEFNRRGGGIFRHEMTLAGGIGDRTKLMAATSAQLSPIFGVFSDPDAVVTSQLAEHFDGRDPDYHGQTDDGVDHRCWIVNDPPALKTLSGHFEGTDVFIADGHHRYTTALQFSKDHVQLPGAANCLFVLVAAEDPGMIVLPTHRVICGLAGISTDKLADLLSNHEDFTLTASADDSMFGIYDPTTKQTVGLNPKHDDVLAEYLPDKPEVWRKLDVAILHEGLIERVLKPQFGPDCVTFKYTADLNAMKTMAGEEPGRLGIIMRSTPLDSVMAVSLADEVMPPKSTYFYPKLATGLVMHPLD